MALKRGDRVQWNTAHGKTTGKVVKKQTRPTRIQTHAVKASRAKPEFIVESEKTGKRAAHKRSALKKLRGS